MEIKEANLKYFSENYNIKRLIKQSTYYKNPNKPTFIDLILTNFPCMVQSACILNTWMSNFHLMTVIVKRKTFKKMRPRVINFSSETFIVSLINNLSNEIFVNKNDGLQKFCKTTMNSLNAFAPTKKRYARVN